MATYQELRDLQRSEVFLDKVEFAIVVAAETIFADGDTTDPPWDQTNNANRKVWAREGSLNPRGMAEAFAGQVLAANKGVSVATILAASDTAIQNNVNAIIDSYANGSAVLG